MEKSKSIGVAIIELLGAAFWPAIALCAILIFKPHLETLLHAAAAQVQNATTIKVGSVDITVSKDNIPKAPLRAGKLLPELDAELMEYILVNNPNDSNTYCFPEITPPELNEDGQINRLSKLHLIYVEELKNHKDPDNTKCERAVRVTYAAIYGSVRNYYFDVLKGLKFTEAK